MMKVLVLLCIFIFAANAAPSGYVPYAASYGSGALPTTYSVYPTASTYKAVSPYKIRYNYVAPTGYQYNYVTPSHYQYRYSTPTHYQYSYATPTAYSAWSGFPGLYSWSGQPSYASSGPAGSQYHAQDSFGQYTYGYNTADGQSKVESRTADGRVSGRFSYMDPTGKLIETTYTADENGFRAEGDHIPKAPAVPDLPDALEDAYEQAKEDYEEAKEDYEEAMYRNAQAATVHLTPAVAPAALPTTYAVQTPVVAPAALPTTYAVQTPVVAPAALPTTYAFQTPVRAPALPSTYAFQTPAVVPTTYTGKSAYSYTG